MSWRQVIQMGWLTAVTAAWAAGDREPGMDANPVFRAERLAEIEAAVRETVKEGQVPGVVYWLEHRQKTFHLVEGHRAIAPTSEAMTADTMFDAASLTKVIATTPCIMRLVERGEIRLDDPVRAHMPEFSGEGRDAITVQHLLTHVSGLRPGLSQQPPWSGYDEAIRRACQEVPRATPGTAFVYSDINFILLGELVRRVSGHRLDVYASQHIFRPLGMTNTGFCPATDLRTRIAPTERVQDEILRGVVHDPTARAMGGVAGHAGLFTTASDLARFCRMMLGHGVVEGVRVFQQETVAQMTRVRTPENLPSRRGLGWDMDSGYSRPRGELFPLGSYGHTGFTGTSIWIDPFSQTFWILLSSRVHPDGQGSILPLQRTLGTLSAEAVADFNFVRVPGSLPTRDPRSAPRTIGRTNGNVLQGVDVLARDQFVLLRGRKVGLITNHTGHDRARTQTAELLLRAPDVALIALFSPEHGLAGALDDKVADSRDPVTDLPVYSLYGERRRPTAAQLEGIDTLVFDIQDIGCRFYTYISTMGHCMQAAAEAGLRFVVLDRVNPINGATIEGPVHQGVSAFTAFHALPLRHGMTAGELARMFQDELAWALHLEVVRVEGWRRDQWFDETGLPWTNPSPNMRRLPAAILYPGVGLLESAVSVGRGTDCPFEVVGAPYVDDVRWAAELNGLGLKGVRFVPARFTPSASVFRGQTCAGVHILLTDRQRCESVDIGLALATTLQRAHRGQFALDKVHTLLQDRPTLEAIREGKTIGEIKRLWREGLQAFEQRRRRFLLYE